MKSNTKGTRLAALHSNRGASLVEHGLLVGLVSVVSIAAVYGLGREVEQTFNSTSSTLAGHGLQGQVSPAQSCNDHYDAGARADGIYTISLSSGEVRVACHFETSGALEGGWTAVVNQLEASDLTDWNQGISVARADGGYFDTSFALSSAQLPAHSATAFGRQTAGTMEILEGVPMTYTTGNFGHTGAGALPGLVDSSMSYDVARNSAFGWFYNDPESGEVYGEPWWNDSLVFDANTPADGEVTWAYSPNVSGGSRGYNYNGHVAGSSENYGWVVFVR